MVSSSPPFPPPHPRPRGMTRLHHACMPGLAPCPYLQVAVVISRQQPDQRGQQPGITHLLDRRVFHCGRGGGGGGQQGNAGGTAHGQVGRVTQQYQAR